MGLNDLLLLALPGPECEADPGVCRWKWAGTCTGAWWPERAKAHRQTGPQVLGPRRRVSQPLGPARTVNQERRAVLVRLHLRRRRAVCPCRVEDLRPCRSGELPARSVGPVPGSRALSARPDGATHREAAWCRRPRLRSTCDQPEARRERAALRLTGGTPPDTGGAGRARCRDPRTSRPSRRGWTRWRRAPSGPGRWRPRPRSAGSPRRGCRACTGRRY